ncbi:MAG: hypothetical protein H5U07_00085 [Candidatus Aminicenantes bacterium]|nr:hypothetical protein [Candidatus Aminicenantes bacterium]
MNKISIFVLGLFLVFTLLPAQIDYPFLDAENDRDIQAYWYNIPAGSIALDIGQKLDFHSSLHIYGKAPADEFQVGVKVFLKNGDQVLEKRFDINLAVESNFVEFRNDFFKITHPVEYLKENPDRIVVTLSSAKGSRSKDIECRYHKLSGKITDFNGEPFKAPVAICPDGFASDSLGKWSDEQGHYEIYLPERTYNAIIAFPKSYAVTELEVWAWHIIMDADQSIDFKVGTGEVYNLNVWPNNGGGSSYFISFRPMVLWAMEQKTLPVTLNQAGFSIMDASPELEPPDLKITVNGKEVEIISCQKYYETGSPGRGMPAYLVQVSSKGLQHPEKKTVIVEYKKEVERDQNKVMCTSMGIFQFYLNYNGLSKHF